MRRRNFVFASILLPWGASAQRLAKTATIGLIAPEAATFHAPSLAAFRRGLFEHGYVEGRNLRLELRYADGKLERLAAFARELSVIPVDVLVTVGSHVTRVAQKATSSVPIVMAYAGDPVGGGLVASLARPGGRITGLTTVSPQLAAKRLELLKEVLPRADDVGVVWNPAVPERVIQYRETSEAAKKLNVALHSFEVRTAEQIAPAMNAAAAKRVDAVIVLDDALVSSHQTRIVQLALEKRLPSLYQRRDAAQFGGLASYGPSFPDLHYRAAKYVDRILKGAKPGDLPVEQPTRFELVVNAKAARALGIEIPKSVLFRADEVIE